MIIKTYFVISVDGHMINVTANEFNRDIQAFGWKLSKDPINETDTRPLFSRNSTNPDAKESYIQYVSSDSTKVVGRVYHTIK